MSNFNYQFMKKTLKSMGVGGIPPQFKAKRILLSLILLLGSTNLVIYAQSIRPGNQPPVSCDARKLHA